MRFFIKKQIFLLILNLAFSGFLFASGNDAGLGLEGRSNFILKNSSPTGRSESKFKIYEVLLSAARNGCSTDFKDMNYFLSVLNSFPVFGDGSVDIDPFFLPVLVRYIYQYSECVSDAQKLDLLNSLTRSQRLFDHGTTNMAVMRATSWYLLAQFFKSAIWLDVSGNRYTSRELMDLELNNLKNRFSAVVQFAHDEIYSPTYSLVNFIPLLNLIDFSKDRDVADSADLQANIALLALKLHSFQGVVMSPLTRGNYEQKLGGNEASLASISISQQLLWFYFGKPELAVQDFNSVVEPLYAIFFVISGWRPSKLFTHLNKLDLTKKVRRVVIPSFTFFGEKFFPDMVGDIVTTQNYAIGISNLVFKPDWYYLDNRQFSIVFKTSDVGVDLFECYHQYWKGGDAPHAWGRDRSSPFFQGAIFDSETVVFSLKVPTVDPWVSDKNNRFFKYRAQVADGLRKNVKCKFSDGYTDIVAEGDFLLFRYGETVFGLRLLGQAKFDYSILSQGRFDIVGDDFDVVLKLHTIGEDFDIRKLSVFLKDQAREVKKIEDGSLRYKNISFSYRLRGGKKGGVCSLPKLTRASESYLVDKAYRRPPFLWMLGLDEFKYSEWCEE